MNCNIGELLVRKFSGSSLKICQNNMKTDPTLLVTRPDKHHILQYENFDSHKILVPLEVKHLSVLLMQTAVMESLSNCGEIGP
jgi:hypothetical protein